MAESPLQIYRRLLEQWRKVMDLVGPGPVDPHFEDSIRAVEGLKVEGCWADLGSGAGFPGVILAILHPLAQVDLVERRSKRASFLEQVVAQAGLKNAQIRCCSTEDLEPNHYQGLISRAYKPPIELLPEARRLLCKEGQLVLMLAREAAPEAADFYLEHEQRYRIQDHPRQVVSLRWRGP